MSTGQKAIQKKKLDDQEDMEIYWEDGRPEDTLKMNEVILIKKLEDKTVYFVKHKSSKIIFTDLDTNDINGIKINRLRHTSSCDFHERGFVKEYNPSTNKFTVEFDNRSKLYELSTNEKVDNTEYMNAKEILDNLDPSSKQKWADSILSINIDVQIKYWVFDNKIYDSYYIINYNSNMNERNKSLHPLFDSRDIDKSSYKGEVIKRNTLTTAMIDYLLLDEDTLSNYTGNTTPLDYKKNIMKSLTLFWD